MNDIVALEEQLEKRRAVEKWLGWAYRQQQQRVRELEEQIDAQRRRGEKARRERSWMIQPERAGRPAVLHRGGCALHKAELESLLTREEALIALEDGLEACEICAPESDLRG
ncbi:DUF6233 domain-containing protein [Streptomyces albidoflavus]|uniref:DUF6233 domain-containing protein n=1 Tax=Streptomyces sp. NRRL F-6628 TaxID=1463876 RepID=UPI00055E3C92|nr:DUF6233 domain-containing protein [Streptomyces sp. NRRL F-6628]